MGSGPPESRVIADIGKPKNLTTDFTDDTDRNLKNLTAVSFAVLPPVLCSSVFQGFRFIQCYPCSSVVRFPRMEKKIFWLLFAVLGLALDLVLPIWWSLALTLPLLVLCWWVAYKSGWFQ